MIALRLWRQRRRILLAMGFACLAGLGFGGADWLWMLCAALFSGAVMAVTVIVVPGLRWFVLKLALISALTAALSSVIGTRLDALVPFALLALAILPAQHRWLDRFQLAWISRSSARTKIARSVDAVWQVVRPVPGAPYWDPLVEGIQLAKKNDELLLKRRLPGGKTIEHPIQLLDVAPIRYLKIRDLDPPAVRDDGWVTVTAFTFDGDHEQCTLLLTEATWHRPVWTAISLWVDDYLGDHADHMAARIEERYDPSLRGTILRSLGRV